MDTVESLQAQISELKEKLALLQTGEMAEPMNSDWLPAGVTWDLLFDGRSDLILIHNMGKKCRYCTMWADTLTSSLPYLESRASVVLVSPDPAPVQQAFAESRGWRYRLLSDPERQLSGPLGFYNEKDGDWPGTSVLHRDSDGSVTRTGKAFFGPGDEFCPPWAFFALLKGGAGNWEPDAVP
jgi:predicted dithiol-disulfide oxidoreductase (DUF899 family)